jgi:hypothetical protein
VFAIRRHDRGRPRSRTLRAAMLALIIGSTTVVAGCSAPNRLNSAVYLRDGKPTVVVNRCDKKDRVASVTVREDLPEPPAIETGASGSAAAQVAREWNAGTPNQTSPDEIQLLETPPGWRVYTSPDNLLVELREDQGYRVSLAVTGPGYGRDLGAAFTLGDLRSLKTGEVWAKPKPYERERAMSLAAFRKAAKAAC